MFCFILSTAVFSVYIDRSEEYPVTDKEFFSGFEAGLLEAPINCEHIKFFRWHEFEYKFTGDCTMPGRLIRGNWQIDGNEIILTAMMREDTEEGEIDCQGAFHHENNRQQRKACFQKYKKRIMKTFGVFPAEFEVTGKIWITDKLTFAVKMQSRLVSKHRKKKKGFLYFTDQNFGKMYNLKDP